jgi:hypothetical protein
MTLAEFKAWFEGFSENITDYGLTQDQWEKVKAKVAETTDELPITVKYGWKGDYPYFQYPDARSVFSTAHDPMPPSPTAADPGAGVINTAGLGEEHP